MTKTCGEGGPARPGPAETLPPLRIASGRPIVDGRDRRYLTSHNEPALFITSARGSQTRNNVIVQASERGTREETSQDSMASHRRDRLLPARGRDRFPRPCARHLAGTLPCYRQRISGSNGRARIFSAPSQGCDVDLRSDPFPKESDFSMSLATSAAARLGP